LIISHLKLLPVMGKRNKFFKIGISSGTLSKSMNTNLKKKEINKLNKTEFLIDDIEKEEENRPVPNLNTTIINEQQLNKQSSLLGIDKDQLRSFLQNPIRHRRPVTKIVLSKGQKKRLEKKEKFKRKEILCEKIKLSNSMMNQTNKTFNKITNNSMNLTKINNEKDQFNLFDIKNTIGDLMDDIVETKADCNTVDNKSKTNRGKRKLKLMLNSEKEKIRKVIENKNYQSNPLEAMKFHIKNTQMLEERKKKINESFQKNYNFLNMKK